MEEFDQELYGLACIAHQEFADIADYIWKSPRLIESETKIEIEKLKAYFPLTDDSENDETAKRLRRMRWEHEERKLHGVFPTVMANGNLFTCLSVFETYCLMLCKSIERRSNKLLSDCKGSGISKFFRFLSKVPIDLDQLAFRAEVRSAIMIRNCLFHASGMLEWSRDSEELRKIVAARAYLSEYTRARISGREFTDVEIVNGHLGEQLQVTNHYAHVVANYLKFHFTDMCKRTQLACNGRCTIELPTSPYYFDAKSADSNVQSTKDK